MLTQKQRMIAGQAYRADDPELVADRERAERWTRGYNHAASDAERTALLEEGLGSVGRDTVVRPPFHCDYGYNIRLGAGVYLNFNCVILDVAPVEVGAGTLIGPGVQILTADHPRDPAERRSGVESGRSITIGRNAWIGGGAIILPGVRIGDNAIVGAGSIVTRDVAAGSTVAGNPARPLGAG